MSGHSSSVNVCIFIRVDQRPRQRRKEQRSTCCVNNRVFFYFSSVFEIVISNVLMTNEMHISYNQFLFHSFLSPLHVSNESSRSSSGARHNILCYAVWYNRYNRAGDSDCFKAARLACTIVLIVLCNTLYYAVLLMMND